MVKTDPQLVEILHSKGFKVTPQRLAIINYLKNDQHSHPTAEEIYLAVKEEVPSIGQATVYKTLSMLTEIGYLTELNLGKYTRYDVNTGIHVNIICPSCGCVTDHESPNVAMLWSNVVNEVGGEVEGQRLDIYRRCAKCTPEKQTAKDVDGSSG